LGSLLELFEPQQCDINVSSIKYLQYYIFEIIKIKNKLALCKSSIIVKYFKEMLQHQLLNGKIFIVGKFVSVLQSTSLFHFKGPYPAWFIL
jgi:hypothetical protein